MSRKQTLKVNLPSSAISQLIKEFSNDTKIEISDHILKTSLNSFFKAHIPSDIKEQLEKIISDFQNEYFYKDYIKTKNYSYRNIDKKFILNPKILKSLKQNINTIIDDCLKQKQFVTDEEYINHKIEQNKVSILKYLDEILEQKNVQIENYIDQHIDDLTIEYIEKVAKTKFEYKLKRYKEKINDQTENNKN